MGRSSTGVQWAEVQTWAQELERRGYRVRVVMGFESPGKLRVSVTLAQLDGNGHWHEAHRQGECISDRSENGAEKAALRACARLSGQLDVLENDRGIADLEYMQLPLPLKP